MRIIISQETVAARPFNPKVAAQRLKKLQTLLKTQHNSKFNSARKKEAVLLTKKLEKIKKLKEAKKKSATIKRNSVKSKPTPKASSQKDFTPESALKTYLRLKEKDKDKYKPGNNRWSELDDLESVQIHLKHETPENFKGSADDLIEYIKKNSSKKFLHSKKAERLIKLALQLDKPEVKKLIDDDQKARDTEALQKDEEVIRKKINLVLNKLETIRREGSDDAEGTRTSDLGGKLIDLRDKLNHIKVRQERLNTQ